MHGPGDDDGWFELDPEDQQLIRETWDAEDFSALDDPLDEDDVEDDDEDAPKSLDFAA